MPVWHCLEEGGNYIRGFMSFLWEICMVRVWSFDYVRQLVILIDFTVISFQWDDIWII